MEHSDIEHMAQGYPPSHISKDCEEVITWLATQLLATQEQRDALAAENAALRKAHPQPFGPIMMQALDAYQAKEDEIPEQGMMDAFFILRDSIRISQEQTDAYLNSVRAEGVQMLLNKYAPHTIASSEASEFAAQLRAGKESV